MVRERKKKRGERRASTKFLWHRQRHFFLRKMGVGECVLRTIIAIRVLILRLVLLRRTAARGGTFGPPKSTQKPDGALPLYPGTPNQTRRPSTARSLNVGAWQGCVPNGIRRALPRRPFTLSRFRDSGVPCATALSADSPRPVRARTKALVPRPQGGLTER